MPRLLPLSAACLAGFFGLGLAGPPSPPVQAVSGGLIPLHVKTGLWQNHSTITLTGSLGLPPDLAAKLTPEQRARYEAAMNAAAGSGHSTESTSKGCLTQKDLTTDPYKLDRKDEDVQCHGTVLTSSASDLEVHESCTGQAQMDFNMKIHALDSEHASGVGDGTATVGGHTMKSHIQMDMHWLGPSCPADGQH